MEALRVWPTIDQDVIHECTQRKEREWWEGDKHIAVMAMTEVLCLTWLSIWTSHYFLGTAPGIWGRVLWDLVSMHSV